MTYIEAKLAWFFFMVLLAFVWGIFCGLTGRDLKGRKIQ
jgi:hypothetical protein